MDGEAGEVLSELTEALQEIRETSRVEGLQYYLAADRAVLLLNRLSELLEEKKPLERLADMRTLRRKVKF